MPLFASGNKYYNTCQRQNIFLGTNHPTLNRNAMLVTGGNRRLISRTSPLGFPPTSKSLISPCLEKYNFTVLFTSTWAASHSKCSHSQLSLMRTQRGISLLRDSQVKVTGVILHFSAVRYVTLYKCVVKYSGYATLQGARTRWAICSAWGA